MSAEARGTRIIMPREARSETRHLASPLGADWSAFFFGPFFYTYGRSTSGRQSTNQTVSIARHALSDLVQVTNPSATMARALLLLSLAGMAAAFAPARAPARGATITMAKLSLPKVSLPTFEPAEPKGPIRGPNPNKGNYRVVGKAGYTIGDKVDAAFCFVPLGEGSRNCRVRSFLSLSLISRFAPSFPQPSMTTPSRASSSGRRLPSGRRPSPRRRAPSPRRSSRRLSSRRPNSRRPRSRACPSSSFLSASRRDFEGHLTSPTSRHGPPVFAPACFDALFGRYWSREFLLLPPDLVARGRAPVA